MLYLNNDQYLFFLHLHIIKSRFSFDVYFLLKNSVLSSNLPYEEVEFPIFALPTYCFFDTK